VARGAAASVVSASPSIAEIARALAENPEYVIALTKRIAARTEDPIVVDRLVAYARERQISSAHAIARHLLTEAGVSWEAI
jgi:hypothetical protein